MRRGKPASVCFHTLNPVLDLNDMSISLSAERDRIQRQVEELEQSLSVTQTELELLSSDTDEESDDDVIIEPVEQSAAGLLAQRQKIQKEIHNLETILGPHSPISVSDDDASSRSDESELDLSVDSCLQMNLVYQQVVQETLDQLEALLTQNHRQQNELKEQLSGPFKESSSDQPSSSYQQPISKYLGRFLKPYFKDKLTGLGPPANQEAKEKSSRMTGCLDDKKLKVKRWESWQKTLLIHSVSRDSLRRLIQPKLSRVDYLSQKLSSAGEADRQQLREQIDSLEREIDLLRAKKEEELIGDRYEEHDWQKISNIDFEGTRDAEDIQRFWQNYLHPSINKTRWSPEEVQQLKEVSRKFEERHWEDIAQELGTGRTAFMCLQTFQRFVSDSLRRRTWTHDEDALLRELVDKMRIGNFIPYTQMSYFMEGRDPAQLIYRWNQVLDPSLKKGPWTKQEDQLLLQAVSRHGEKDWWKIRLEIPGRTDSACRDRYHDCLKAGTKRGAFDKEERELLQQLLEKHGVGRWAKIAAEIPHRNDAQCLREWKKLCRQLQPPAQKKKEAKKTRKSRGEKKVSPAKKRIRRQLTKVKEEEASTEEEDEEMLVQYMDSDEEKKKKKCVEVERLKEVQKQEVEDEEKYTWPSMDEWIPDEKEHLTLLNFLPVVLPSSDDTHSGKPVRSTIVGKFGRSVIIGPSPRVLQSDERYSSSTMMMVSSNQLQTYLLHKAYKLNNQSSQPKEKLQSGKQTYPGRVTDTGLGYELQASVTPWIGNLLIPVENRLSVADALRERQEKNKLPSTPVFLLFLQTMNVDAVGCREMIEQRRDKELLLTLPPDPSLVKKNPHTVAGMLQQRKAMKEGLQVLDLQHKQILKQLQVLQQQEKPKPQQLVLRQQIQPQQLVLMQQLQPLPPCLPPSMPSNVAFIPRPVPQPQSPLNPSPQTQESVCSSQTEVDAGQTFADVQKMSALQEASEAEAGAKKNCSGPQIQNTNTPPKLLCPESVQVLPQTPPSSSTMSPPSCCDREGSTPQNLSSPSTCLPDHDYTLVNPNPSPSQHRSDFGPSSAPDQTNLQTPKQPPKNQPRGRKREREEQQMVASSEEGQCLLGTGVDGTGTGVIQKRKRVRKLTQKAQALQEANKAQAEAKKKRTSSPQKKPSRTSRCKKEVRVLMPPVAPPPRLCLFPGQSIWVMAPRGLVQLAEAPPQGMQMALVQGTPLPLGDSLNPPTTTAPVRLPPSDSLPVAPNSMSVSVPVNVTLQNRPLTCPSPLTPAFVLQPVPNPLSSPIPSHLPKLPLPYNGTVRVDTAEPPPLRKEALQFDPSLMFLEPKEEVCDWLSGRGGVVVKGANVALPYLPPFISSLSTLSLLLRAKKSLTQSSLQLLQGRVSEPRQPQSELSIEQTSSQPPPELPDSTSDLRPAEDQPANYVGPDIQEEEEAELIASVRQLVAERFSSNPAYQLLKARFLSCFTIPALMATIQPITHRTTASPAKRKEEEEEEEEDEEVVELKRIKERGRRRRAERALLLHDGSGAPANHFSEFISHPTPTSGQTRQVQAGFPE
ncbi:snRNA-activating protein complex subunit 4 isoform X1 [Channa argus]